VQLIFFTGYGLYSKEGKTFGIDVSGASIIPIDDLIHSVSVYNKV